MSDRFTFWKRVNRQLIKVILLAVLFCFGAMARAQVWPLEKAQDWYSRQGWLVGANYTPAYAINQLEFWQAETFDLAVIDSELGLAEGIGMSCMRVYLHHLAWVVDKPGFKMRIDKFLTIASRHRIKIMFVFFDDCWNDTYVAGKQPVPKPGIHNSGWVKDPGNRAQTDKFLLDTLEAYVKDVVGAFRKDKRILLWDLYNEPGHFEQGLKSLPLLRNVFAWAREVHPLQPLTAGIYSGTEPELGDFQLKNSDIVTYHDYTGPDSHRKTIDSLRDIVGLRPMICTEYMARKRGSTFKAILPMLKKERIGAVNWGLVDGKTQTKYAWDERDWGKAEPSLWFHDIFRKDGKAYDPQEIKIIKELILGKIDVNGK